MSGVDIGAIELAEDFVEELAVDRMVKSSLWWLALIVVGVVVACVVFL